MRLSKESGYPPQPAETSTRRRKAFAFFKEKKEWVKLNASYVTGTVMATGCAYASSYTAEKCGVDRMHATTWISGLSAYLGGVTAICASWWLLHKDRYVDNAGKLARDCARLVTSTSIAQGMTWVVSLSGAALAVAAGASNAMSVTVQQVLDRLVFIPAFNMLNRKQVKGMEGERKGQ
jgi:hypothetical protein